MNAEAADIDWTRQFDWKMPIIHIRFDIDVLRRNTDDAWSRPIG